MRIGVGARLLALGLLLGRAPAAWAETPIPPAPERWVTDRAAFLSAGTTAELDARLAAYDRQTGHQLLVYIDRTTGGVPIEDWAVKAFESWRVGRKGIDDGLVLFVFSDDQRVRIEVGYGLEDHIPDAAAARIIRERIVPRIQAGDRDGAIKSGVDALILAAGSGEGGAAAQPKPISKLQLVLGAIALIVFIGFALTHPRLAWLMLLSIGSGGRGGGLGGGRGGGFSGGGGRSGGGGASGSW